MGILRHPYLQIKQTLFCNKWLHTRKLFQSNQKKKAYRGSTDLLQNKNNIKPQNNEKKNNIVSHMLNVQNGYTAL